MGRPYLAKVLLVLLVMAAMARGLGYVTKDRLPGPGQIEQDCLRAPDQHPTNQGEFTFDCRGHTFAVRPLAEYDLSGLVVRHDDVHSMLGLLHGGNSVDTKDVAVVWGHMLQGEAYRQATYESKDGALRVRWSGPRPFDMTEVSNNHLITSSDALRRTIDAVHVGDQIRVKGLLVTCRAARAPSGSMPASTPAWEDTSNGTCDVVFVESLETLKAANRPWRVCYAAGGWGMAILPILLLANWIVSLKGMAGERPMRCHLAALPMPFVLAAPDPTGPGAEESARPSTPNLPGRAEPSGEPAPAGPDGRRRDNSFRS